MNVQGRDCTLVVLTSHIEMSIPYSEETIRENVTLLEEYPGIEGKGNVKAIRTSCGAAGCVVSPLTIGAAPLLLYLAFGEVRFSACISEIGNLYKNCIDLVPLLDTDAFGLLQDRGGDKKYYAGCRVKSFELRILRDEAIKLKLDISSEKAPIAYPVDDQFTNDRGERFKGENVEYHINERKYKNVYGVTLAVKKENGVKSELWIRRVLEKENDLPETIDKLAITASLLRDRYGEGHFGKLRITLRNLILSHDETSIECDDSAIGPLRYFVNGEVIAEVFTTGEGSIP